MLKNQFSHEANFGGKFVVSILAQRSSSRLKLNFLKGMTSGNPGMVFPLREKEISPVSKTGGRRRLLLKTIATELTDSQTLLQFFSSFRLCLNLENLKS